MKTAVALLSFALLCAFQDPPAAPDFAAEVKALKTEFQKAQREYSMQSRAAKTPEERRAIKNPAAAYLQKFQELADRAKGTEGGAAALLEVFQMAQSVPKSKEAGKKALETLIGSHAESPLMERLASSLRYAGHYVGEDTVRTALETIRDKSTPRKAQAAAIFTLAAQDMDRDEKAARAGFERLKKEFEGTTYAGKADGFLFELDNLQIGKVAPDFEATDETGVKWKLYDYRGKVTVIDFWGFW
jgi:hypothetical protein